MQGKEERKKEEEEGREKKSLHKTLERAEGYNEIIHMRASRSYPARVTSTQSTDSVLNHGEFLIKYLKGKRHLG